MNEPQLIFLHDGAFRKGRLVGLDESRYIGLDIEGNCVLEEGDISPLALQLVYATSLSPRLLKKTVPKISDDIIISKLFENKIKAPDRDPRYYARQISGVVYGIVNEAGHLAKDSGVPYFSVAAVSASFKPLNLNEPITEKAVGREEYFHNKLSTPQPAREVQFTLHPTVQLYVPRDV